ncbi:peptide synthase [Xenorhabdus beddingii]|uniref:Peptide synthase n=1 Tax=Xenorhabdus beddingii TaxID=40578 RepID=A0A1Y2SSC4_9GAMM|nr:non-ribosomal peptide synthetase [Xenorhabdus beddingii]OTA21794.1 peptide synthase [Xenorhabdus beddingii]
MHNETLYNAVKDTLDHHLKQYDENKLNALSITEARQCANLLSEFLNTRVNAQDIQSSFSIHNLVELLICKAPELNDRTYLPGTYGQKGIWLLTQTLSQPESYNVPLLVEISATLDSRLLERALNQLIEINPILRTRFAFNQSQLYQVIEPTYHFNIVQVSLDNLSQPENVIRNMSARQYDLANGPLFDICLITTGSERCWLACCFHHIIVDAPSVRIILRELLQCYSHLTEYGEYSTRVTSANYLKFTQWQKELLVRPETAAMKDYWKKVLTPYPPMIDLPVDHSRKECKGIKAGYYPIKLAHADELRISKQAQKLAMTPFMYMTLCWQFLLHRLSGQKDITIGIPFTLRDQSEFEETIGYLINTLPFRSYLDPDITVNQFAASVRDRFIESHLNKQLPFGEIVASTNQSSGSGHPIFQTLLVMPDTKDDAFQNLPFSVKLTEQYGQAAKYDLTLFIEMGQSHQLVMEFNAELFEESTIQYWLELYKQSVLQMGEWGDKTLGEIDLLTQNAQLALSQRSSMPLAGAGYQCFISEIERYTKAHPNNIALMTRHGQWSYEWLDHRSNQLAHFLYTHYGVSVGSRVGLLLERNADSIASLLAVLKTGASYVPVDPDYPQERIEYMLKDAAVDCLITTGAVHKLVASLATHIPQIVLDDTVSVQRVNWQSVQRQPDDELYIIYTSGSTGQPKGVRLLNKTLSNLLSWQKNVTVCGEGDCTLHYMSLSFDVSVQEIFGTLCTGGKLYISDEEERKDLHHLQGVIELNSIRRAYFPYVALQHLAQLTVMNECRLHTLDEVYSTGEQLVLTSDIKQMFNHHRRLINLYGPSESHVCSAYILPTDTSAWGDAASIGYPLPGFTLLALDKSGRMVPAGVAGELWILSDFLSPGYHNKHNETQTRFFTRSWPGALSQHAYKSGDLIKLEHNDTLTYLGRIDNQLKIRGFRIEPSEVEAVLNAFDGVKVSAVIGKEISAGNRQLVAFVATAVSLHSRTLLEKLRDYLPDYMIPSELVFLPDLPTTPSGKIDRKALHHIDIKNKYDVTSDSYEKVFTNTEQTIKLLWQQIFPNQHIKVKDDFFTIGGHSLLATQLVYLLRKQFNADFPLKLLFNNPTLRDMAASVDSVLTNGKRSSHDIEKTFIHDATVPHDWTYVQRTSVSESGNVLLTGATGFLGIYLLRSLLSQLTGDIFCLIRAKDIGAGLARVKENAQRYGIEYDIDFSRIKIIIGDVAKKNLGLTEQEYQSLSERVSKVYHCAAHINFVLPYRSVKGTNVDGIVEIIHFCCHYAHKKLEYISTIAVFAPDYPHQPITENSLPDYPHSLSIGYTQSKWVAEQYVQDARSQGVDINIYRIGRISGDSMTGACQEDDFLWRQIKSFIQMRAAPFPELLATDLLPVDFVAQAIVALSTSKKSGHNFHLFHPKSTNFTPIYQAIEQTGHDIEIVSESKWLEKLEQMVVDGHDVALGSLIHLFKEDVLNIGDHLYNNQITCKAIKTFGLDFPNINVETFKKLIGYFMDKEIINNPKNE